eukprot:5866840-Alexandrium_andersonii.AAC.1
MMKSRGKPLPALERCGEAPAASSTRCVLQVALLLAPNTHIHNQRVSKFAGHRAPFRALSMRLRFVGS